ncbi:MAG: FUSC family protein [Actinobacteria bacterium]|nr:FUSC family protein [Actinomycetota bacterium]
MSERRLAREITRATFVVDWAAVRWFSPLRAGVVCGALALIAVSTGHVYEAMPLGLGALFAGLGDSRGPLAPRIRLLFLTAVLLGVAAFFGAVIAGHPLWHVLTSALVAGLCGFAGIAGPHAARLGVLVMVTFIIFSGTPTTEHSAFESAVLMLVGGLCQVAVITLPLLTRRLGGMREGIAITYRTLGFALRQGPQAAASPTLALRLIEAEERIAESTARGATRAWLTTFTEAGDCARLSYVALTPDGEPEDAKQRALIDDFAQAGSDLAFAIANALEFPWQKGRVPGPLERFSAAAAACIAGVPTVDRVVAVTIERDLRAAAEATIGPWPVGRKAELSLHVGLGHTRQWRVRPHLRLSDPFMRHAVRLAALIAIATVLSKVDGFPHGYWLPMTIAWISRPDFAGTAVKTFARVLGTLAGLFAVVLVVTLFGSSPWVIVPTLVVTAMCVYAFAIPNYTIMTAGITAYIVALFVFAGDPLREDVPARAIATFGAALLVLIAAYVWRTRSSEALFQQVARTADALAVYAQLARQGTDDDAGRIAARTRMQDAHFRASTAIAAAANEPGRHPADPAIAEQVLDDIVRAVGFVTVEDVGDRDSAELASDISDVAIAHAQELALRLDAVADTGHAPSMSSFPRQPDEPGFAAMVRRAHERLDQLAAQEGDIVPV